MGNAHSIDTKKYRFWRSISVNLELTPQSVPSADGIADKLFDDGAYQGQLLDGLEARDKQGDLRKQGLKRRSQFVDRREHGLCCVEALLKLLLAPGRKGTTEGESCSDRSPQVEARKGKMSS